MPEKSFSLRRWQTEGARWRTLMDIAYPHLESFAEGVGAVLTRCPGEAPGFELRWNRSDDIDRSVRITLEETPEGYTFSAGGSAWRDTSHEDTRVRHYGTLDCGERVEVPSEISLPAEHLDFHELLKREKVGRSVKDVAETCVRTLNGVSESFLERSMPLPPLPPGVDLEMLGKESSSRSHKHGR